ncbi:hypothetical protein Q8W25_08365 [Shimia thalassica]|uniref:glycosyltransferase family 2 protein n=1 Tax=Shimia thalassica TaxID=1715693 RepID=UPI0027353658|nr:glycosyltransferase [Shimia thalassica]MDP2494025.1 hypothetical protein [Shimia thalassica]
MSATFQHQLYLANNPDLAERFDVEDELGIREHYERFGRNELRGIATAEYVRVEGVIYSDEGHILIAGWADLRLMPNFTLTVSIGFINYEIPKDALCWYHREDVSSLTGGSQDPAGFIGMIELESFEAHGNLSVWVMGLKCYEDTTARFLDSETFLDRALAACAVFADRPIGENLKHAEKLLPGFQDIWKKITDKRKYVCTFNSMVDTKVERSIVIVLHRKSNMLIPQLTSLSPYLEDQNTEVIIVGNELVQHQLVVDKLTAFGQIHAFPVSLHLCSGNAGFSAANNFGASQARGDTIIFMNPDIFPPERHDPRIENFVLEPPGDKLIGAMLYYGDGLLMHSGMYATGDTVCDPSEGARSEILRVEHFGKGLIHHIDAPLPNEIAQVAQNPSVLTTAALWKIDRSTFFEAGGLPEDYLYAYYEDADFCLTFLKAGKQIEIDANAHWFHLEGVGSEKPPFLRTAMWLNRIHFSKRFSEDSNILSSVVDLAVL